MAAAAVVGEAAAEEEEAEEEEAERRQKGKADSAEAGLLAAHRGRLRRGAAPLPGGLWGAARRGSARRPEAVRRPRAPRRGRGGPRCGEGAAGTPHPDGREEPGLPVEREGANEPRGGRGRWKLFFLGEQGGIGSACRPRVCGSPACVAGRQVTGARLRGEAPPFGAEPRGLRAPRPYIVHLRFPLFNSV